MAKTYIGYFLSEHTFKNFYHNVRFLNYLSLIPTLPILALVLVALQSAMHVSKLLLVHICRLPLPVERFRERWFFLPTAFKKDILRVFGKDVDENPTYVVSNAQSYQQSAFKDGSQQKSCCYDNTKHCNITIYI